MGRWGGGDKTIQNSRIRKRVGKCEGCEGCEECEGCVDAQAVRQRGLGGFPHKRLRTRRASRKGGV
jgi:hypothetical protein